MDDQYVKYPSLSAYSCSVASSVYLFWFRVSYIPSCLLKVPILTWILPSWCNNIMNTWILPRVQRWMVHEYYLSLSNNKSEFHSLSGTNMQLIWILHPQYNSMHWYSTGPPKKTNNMSIELLGETYSKDAFNSVILQQGPISLEITMHCSYRFTKPSLILWLRVGRKSLTTLHYLKSLYMVARCNIVLYLPSAAWEQDSSLWKRVNGTGQFTLGTTCEMQ